MANVVEMPKLGFDMAEGTLVRWVKAEGESVAKGEVLAEIETDKATVEVESSFAGVVSNHLVTEKTSVPVGTPIAVIAESGEKVDLKALLGERAPDTRAPETQTPAASSDSPVSDQNVQTVPAEGSERIKASPLAKSIARANAVDLSAVKGSGPGGRIVKSDLEAYIKTPPAMTGEPPAFQPLQPPAADRYVPINRLRSAISKRMSESKQQAPHFYVTHEYDADALMTLRSELNTTLEGTGEKISVNDFIVKAAALTLRQYPGLNASLQSDQILLHGGVHVGIAVAMDNGLMTVVCRDADRKPLRQISTEIRSMSVRAREGKVKPEEISGSTFSISNLGMFDVEHFIAIINPPEAAILAVGSVREMPVVKAGTVSAGLRMKATLSVDHRLSDGAEAARFLASLAEYIEQPLKLLL